jgi:chromosomal replication initiator protein
MSPYVYAGIDSLHNLSAFQTVEHIKKAIESTTKVNFDQIQSRKRYKKVVEARHLFHYFVKMKTKNTLKEIGNMSKRDHSSVIHSVKTIHNWLQTDEETKINFRLIEHQLTQLNISKNVATN